MPIIKSAKKRVRVSAKANSRNQVTKNNLKSALKKFTAAIKSGKNVNEAHSEIQSAVDTAVKKGILHKNKAARRKSQLATAAKNAGATVKGSAKPKATAKPAVKKAPVKKAATTKKPIAKKPAVKKAK